MGRVQFGEFQVINQGQDALGVRRAEEVRDGVNQISRGLCPSGYVYFRLWATIFVAVVVIS